MNRIELAKGTIITSNNYDYVIDSKLGAGATSIVYSAHYTESNGYEQKVILKECYPFDAGAEREDTDLVWKNNNKEKHIDAFHNAYRKMMQMQNISGLRNVTSRLFDMFEANNTSYSVMDMNEGRTYDDMADDDLVDTLKTTLAVCKVLEKYHNNGYLHLDIKPSNFLVYEDTRELVVLFDLDSVTSMEDIKSGKVKYVPFSQIYGAPEQAQGQINKLCPATDIFSVGAMLFHKVMGRTVTREDMSVYAEWDFDERKFEKTNPKIKRLLKDIFHKTLAANIKRRCQSVSELIPNLKEAIDAANKKQYIVSDYPNSIIKFVGREKELDDIHSLFRNGSTSVFIHGYRGIGKTEVAKKYIEKYKNEYDAVVYVDYDKMNGIVSKIEITNSDEQKSDAKKLKKLCGEENILFVVDNIDAENDDDVNIAISHAEEIMSTGAHVLFTTRNDYSEYYNSEKVIIYPLGKFETEELVVIFKNEYGKTISSEEEKYVEDIIESFDNWTMLIPMITKYIIASGKTIKMVKEQLEKDGFSSSREKISLMHNSKIHRENPNDFLRYMFNLENITENHRIVLRNMYCLNKHKHLSKDKYRLYTYEEDLTYLNDMIFFGWVDYDKNTDKLSIQAVLYDLIRTDMEPTSEDVPGIFKYIKEQFDKLEQYDSIDDVKSITYAMLLYTEFKYDKEEYKNLYFPLAQFIYDNYYINKNELYKLLFTSSDESTWYMKVSGTMQTIMISAIERFTKNTHEKLDINRKRIDDLRRIVNERNLDENENEDIPDDLRILFDEVEYSLDDLHDEQSKSELLLLNTIYMEVTLTVAYFSFMKMQEYEIPYIEELMKVFHLEAGAIEKDVISKEGHLIVLISLFAELCKEPIYDQYGNLQNNIFENIEEACLENYAYYEKIAHFTWGLLMLIDHVDMNSLREYYSKVNLPKGLRLYDNQENILNLLNRLLISIENSLGKFCFWANDTSAYKDYELLDLEEYKEAYGRHKLLHWSKKAIKWYNSVQEVLTREANVYPVYKLLLNFEYNRKYLKSSKTAMLYKNNLADIILSDDRITKEEKIELLLIWPAEQLNCFRKNNKNFYVKQLIKEKNLLNLYTDGINKSFCWLNGSFNDITVENRIKIYDMMLMLKRYYDCSVPDVTEYLSEDIIVENVRYVPKILDAISMIKYGDRTKVVRELKTKVLDVVLKTDFESLSKSLGPEIMYFTKPVAVKYKNQKVMDKILAEENNLSYKYYLQVLSSDNVSLKEKRNIVNSFLADYVRTATMDKYNKVYNIVSDFDFKDWIEALEYCNSQIYDYLEYGHKFGNYSYVFWQGLFETELEDSYYRFDPGLCAWEISEPLGEKESLGLCFMIAERYSEYIDNRGAPWSYPLENALNNWLLGSYENSLTDEEQNDGVAKIIDICPDAAYDIARFTEEHIEYL